MSTKDAHLYNFKKSKGLQGKELVSSSSLAFASQLSSLISNSKTTDTPKGRTTTGRTRAQKEDIFSKHNKGIGKRAQKDLDDADFEQKHSRASEVVDDAAWRRAKRKMEEKARLYGAMKRGDVHDDEGKYGVNFDQKWAEAKERGENPDDTTSGESDDDAPASDEELVEFLDEFGRLIKGTKAQAAREERRKARGHQETSDKFTARPSMPTNVIFGDTVQSAAFNPSETHHRAMEELAAKRDRSLTPPPAEHFDARKEFRTKGVGFFQFSADEEERTRQLAELERERAETEKRRGEVADRKEKRRLEVEERRRLLVERRSKAQADRFLENLTGEIGREEVEK